MKLCKVYLEGLPGSPYSQSGFHTTERLDRESHDDYDERTWRNHCTTNDKGQVCIPSMALKQCIDTGAYKLGFKVPNRRGATFKGFFASGFFCNGDVPIANGKALTKDDAEIIAILASSTGRRGPGAGSRVQRRYPVFPVWNGWAEFTITDDIITSDIFEQHVATSGLIVGIGRFRPENGGTNGRFRASKYEWRDLRL